MACLDRTTEGDYHVFHDGRSHQVRSVLLLRCAEEEVSTRERVNCLDDQTMLLLSNNDSCLVI